mgnify:FL=1
MDADVYQDRQDTTVSVAVKLRDEEDAYAVFWTTTPWTVPTNFAIVVGADIDYVEVRPTEGKFAGKKFYLGKPLLGSYAKELGDNYEIVRELKGAEMEGWRYYPVFPYFAGDENAVEGKVPVRKAIRSSPPTMSIPLRVPVSCTRLRTARTI